MSVYKYLPYDDYTTYLKKKEPLTLSKRNNNLFIIKIKIISIYEEGFMLIFIKKDFIFFTF